MALVTNLIKSFRNKLKLKINYKNILIEIDPSIQIFFIFPNTMAHKMILKLIF